MGDVQPRDRRALGVHSETGADRRLVEIQISDLAATLPASKNNAASTCVKIAHRDSALTMRRFCIVELEVMVGAQSVLPAQARQQVERYLVAGANSAEHGPPAKRQHPAPVGQRERTAWPQPRTGWKLKTPVVRSE